MQLRHGDRALVTGASHGIGEAFARELASRGVELVLLARSEERLHDLAGQLTGTSCRVLPWDLRRGVPSATELGHIDLLINNAGFGATGPFEDWDQDWAGGMVDVNVRALVTLTREVVSGMLERGRGGILNVASVAGFLPLPYFAEYSATKAFVLSFSRALHVEYARRGVTVTALCPGATFTRFHAVARGKGPPPMFGQGPDEVARYGLRALEAGKSAAVPGWYNRLGAALSEVAPGGLAAIAAGWVLRRR